MVITDPISDMLVRVKNAFRVRKANTLVPYSKLKLSIAELLLREGYFKSIEKKGKKTRKFLEIELNYGENKMPKINEIARVSKPACRVYLGYKDIKRVRQGFGLSVVSTPKGLMTDREARKAKLGGEVLFKIW